MEFFVYAVNDVYGMNNFYGADKLSVEEVNAREWVVTVAIGSGVYATTKRLVVRVSRSGSISCYAY